MSCLNHNGFANSKNYEIPKLEVKKDICNILQRQAASVSLGQKVSREDVCLQLRNRNPIWLYLCKCPCCLNILSTTAVTSTTPGWCLSHHLSYDLPYSLGVLGCFLQGCAFLLLQQRTEGCRAHGEWAGSQTRTLKRPVRWHPKLLSECLSAFSFLLPHFLLSSLLSGTGKIFSIIFFLPFIA